MSRETIVVLRVLDDHPTREWWEALGLPDPVTWGNEETFGADVLPSPVLEAEVKR